MGEKTGAYSNADLRAIGLEPTKNKPKRFSEGDTIIILKEKLVLATVLSEGGFMAQRLKREVEPSFIMFEGQSIELFDLNVDIGKFHRYALRDAHALITINKYGAGGKNPITGGFLFWGL